MNETTTAAVAVSGSVSEYHIGHTIYRVKTVFNPAFRESLSDILARLMMEDCEKLLEDFIYNFNEASDIALFNRRAEDITKKYAAAQVKKISATFTRTDEEAEYGILHLYIEVVHKALVKIIKVDIDVNRNVETT